MVKAIKKEQARELRLGGMAITKIAVKLEVSKGSVSLWVRDLPKPKQWDFARDRSGDIELAKKMRALGATLAEIRDVTGGGSRMVRSWVEGIEVDDGVLKNDHSEGYVRVKVKGEWVLEHRYVMAQHLGRPLLTEEVIHHIDHDRSNNEVSNLEVVTHSEHMARHAYTPMSKVTCPACYQGFRKPTRIVRWYEKTGMSMHCSRSCAGLSKRKRVPVV